jgi:hypothetical protein
MVWDYPGGSRNGAEVFLPPFSFAFHVGFRPSAPISFALLVDAQIREKPVQFALIPPPGGFRGSLPNFSPISPFPSA